MTEMPVGGPRLVVVDNYDSFTFNVVDLLEQLGARCDVVANDRVTLEELAAASCDAFVVSPGPCSPAESRVSLELYEAALEGRLARPILGICLGHQALAAAAGASIVRARRPIHGKVSFIEHDGLGMFRRAPARFAAAQYNSLVVERASLPPELVVSASSVDTGEVMALRHVRLPLVSVQFHPESHLSEAGPSLLGAWLADVASERDLARDPRTALA